jgi:hypothetical protein
LFMDTNRRIQQPHRPASHQSQPRNFAAPSRVARFANPSEYTRLRLRRRGPLYAQRATRTNATRRDDHVAAWGEYVLDQNRRAQDTPDWRYWVSLKIGIFKVGLPTRFLP